jgi:hypothetical protein
MPVPALKHALRRSLFAVCVLSLPSFVFAQQSGGIGSTTGSDSSISGPTGGPAATEAAASNAGQQLGSQNLFSTTEAGAGVGALGSNQGRFATNQFQNAPTATGTGANTAQGGRTTTNQFRGNQNTRRGNTQNRFGGNARSRQTIRPALRLGFVPPPRPSADVTRSVERRFNTLSDRTAKLADTVPAFRGVSIQVGDAGKVTLTGEVATPQAARLAANILRMEAGVRSVQNDLTVAAR